MRKVILANLISVEGNFEGPNRELDIQIGKCFTLLWEKLNVLIFHFNGINFFVSEKFPYDNL